MKTALILVLCATTLASPAAKIDRIAKLHLKFTVLRQLPSNALIIPGNSRERKALREFIKKAEAIIGDRDCDLEDFLKGRHFCLRCGKLVLYTIKR